VRLGFNKHASMYKNSLFVMGHGLIGYQIDVTSHFKCKISMSTFWAGHAALHGRTGLEVQASVGQVCAVGLKGGGYLMNAYTID